MSGLISWMTGSKNDSTKDEPKKEEPTKEETQPGQLEQAEQKNDAQKEQVTDKDDEKKEDNIKGKKSDYPEIDLVFLMDCTGSMGSYIQKGKESIMSIVEKVKSSEKADVRFCYVAYRDHPPQDNTLITKVHDFTTKPKDMRSYLSKYQASGGGDGPEAVTEALYEASKLSYRKNAIKICMLFLCLLPHFC